MSKRFTDGLPRLQNQSRIPATTWRQWCNLLRLDPIDAVDVWEEICHPIMVATGKVPEVSYILQMRAARLELDIFDFKDEVPKVLHIITFFYLLQDERLTKGKIKSALLKFYRKSALQSSPDQPHGIFLQKFIVDLCVVMLMAKVLPVANISLAVVLKPLVEGHGNIDQLIDLGLKSMSSKPYADKIRECLAERENAANNPQPSPEDAGADADIDDEDRVDRGEDGDDDGYGGEGGDSLEDYLVKFKNALHAIYATEAEAELEMGDEESEGRVEKVEALLDERLKAIALFKPLQATIPSVEEAQIIAGRAEAKRNPGRVQKLVKGIKSGGGFGGFGGGGGATGGVSTATVIKGGGGNGKSKAAQKGKKTAGQSAHADVEGSVDVVAADMVDPEEISSPELSDKAHEIGKLLAAIEPNDQQAWGLVIGPTAQVQNLRVLSQQICTAGTGADKAYNNIKQIARFLKLKDLLNTPDQVVGRDRNFMIEVRGFINGLNNERKFESNSRQLAPLKRILDHAAAALVRLEALKTNFNFSTGHPDSYTRETVTLYYEEALRALTDLADGDICGQARQKADADTDALLAIFRAEQFVEKLLQAVRDYTTGLRDKGATKSTTKFKGACAARPIEFEDVEEGGQPSGVVPDELLVAGDMGDVFDEACRYAITEAWAVMQEVHQPGSVAGRIKEVMREVLIGMAVFTPEMWRHQEQPGMGLAVVSLDKITGNLNLKEYYVRVRDNGEIAFIEGFEEGQYVDLFEMREYKPSRVHAAAKKEKEEDGTEELQTGRKYLFTIGRTDKLFGETPNDLINGCIRAEGGGPKAFNAF